VVPPCSSRRLALRRWPGAVALRYSVTAADSVLLGLDVVPNRAIRITSPATMPAYVGQTAHFVRATSWSGERGRFVALPLPRIDSSARSAMVSARAVGACHRNCFPSHRHSRGRRRTRSEEWAAPVCFHCPALRSTVATTRYGHRGTRHLGRIHSNEGMTECMGDTAGALVPRHPRAVGQTTHSDGALPNLGR
jgi:hypothetical protein